MPPTELEGSVDELMLDITSLYLLINHYVQSRPTGVL